MTEVPTDMGAGAATPRTGPQPWAPQPPSALLAHPTPDQVTQLSTVNTSHGFSQPPPPSRVSRVSLALGLTGATALLVALGIGFVVTRPPANAGLPTKSAEPPPELVSAAPPPAPVVSSSAPVGETPPVTSTSTSPKPQKPPAPNVGKGRPPPPPKPKACDPPYEFDAQGKKHFKPECL